MKKNGKLAHLKDQFGSDALRDAVIAGAGLVGLGVALAVNAGYSRAARKTAQEALTTTPPAVEIVNERN